MATRSGRILLGALDRMVNSSANYWVVMLSDLAAALAFLALGLKRFSGPWVVAGGVAIVGFMSCGLLEYVVHRWVLHGPPSLARRGHAQHHAEPRALISTPLFVIMTGALAIWGLLGLVLPAGLAALLVFGLYAGYNYFALVHHWQHHRGNARGRRLLETSRATPSPPSPSTGRELRYQHHDLGPPVRHVPADA